MSPETFEDRFKLTFGYIKQETLNDRFKSAFGCSYDDWCKGDGEKWCIGEKGLKAARALYCSIGVKK